eukprot:CAMPEP_0172928880 /NCGR_PEP_ID=MMETSP1075-20121228/218200_1 /TAXON_ID=2916 /ORGANISM="Ceratium fusus, Strain PA161109" /LENGTH=255 /DNA_ID=CAMNT_0013790169 /DNA_START=20 /DNA_END=787 /DNA_ORIENTATION=-
MATAVAVLAAVFCTAVRARQVLHRGDRAVAKVVIHAQTGQQGQQTWWDPQTPEMDAAYAHARRDTQPQLVNATDYKYFKELYGTDKDNALEKLSLTSPATQPSKKQVEAQAAREKAQMDKIMPKVRAEEAEAQPSKKQVEAQAAREKAQMDKIMPKVRAEEAEADKYYHNVFPYDTDNPLEEFTYSSKDQGAWAKSNSSLPHGKNATAGVDAAVADDSKKSNGNKTAAAEAENSKKVTGNKTVASVANVSKAEKK